MTDIKACPRCGSQRIYMGTLKAGVIYGLTSWKMQCRECGYQGQPLLFDTEEAYEKFREGLASMPGTSTPVEPVEDEQPDKGIEELLQNTPEQEPREELKEKSWRLEIIVAIVIGAAFTILEVPNFVNNMGATALLYVVLFLVLASLVALAAIVVVEYLYRAVRKPSSKK